MFDLRDQPAESRERLRRVAHATGHPPEAVFLVFLAMVVAGRGLPDSWWTPAEPRPIPEDIPPRHLTAVEVCDAICRCARARAGADAGRFFHLWGLRTGGDVGRIVYGLIADGLGAAGPGDRPGQFDHIPLLRLLNPVRTTEPPDEE
jgi:hypothetical protein